MLIPYFVVDRPISLDIVKGYWESVPAVQYGLLANALTSPRFRRLFAQYPCTTDGFCFGCRRSIAQTSTETNKCQFGKNVIKMGDSGIFNGDDRLTDDDLFQRYESMNVDYGIMVDQLYDKEVTIRSAEQAVRTFNKATRKFRLVLVAQGRNVAEYIQCYRELSNLGEFDIAIGGMLRKRNRTARYLHVSQNGLLPQVLKSIRDIFNPESLFVLGVYHPDRHGTLSEFGVTGSDYKGWIFNYEHRRDMLDRVLSPIRSTATAQSNIRLAQLLDRRNAMIRQLEKRSRSLRGNLDADQLQSGKTRRKSTLGIFQYIDDRILKLMKEMADEDKPYQDQEEWNRALEVLQASDQDIRIAGVHKYFETKVLPNLTNDNLT